MSRHIKEMKGAPMPRLWCCCERAIVVFDHVKKEVRIECPIHDA